MLFVSWVKVAIELQNLSLYVVFLFSSLLKLFDFIPSEYSIMLFVTIARKWRGTFESIPAILFRQT